MIPLSRKYSRVFLFAQREIETREVIQGDGLK